ncbi:MAG: TetR/AcrR family transcriptional regulator [Thermoleophilia bacterium]|nr:TetR/AcrR family transcriptional regulator [Thermoleophilia bacterium]
MAREAASGKRRGRRRGDGGTRDAIAEAARRLFGGGGYDRVTLRAIAAEAGVDPALVLHYFGSKERLFLSVAGLPVPPQEVLARLAEGDRASAGLRLTRFVLDRLADPRERARITAVVRAAVSEPAAAKLMREQLTLELMLPLAEALGSEDAALRANLAGSQVVGLIMARYVVGIEPLASAPAETVAAAVAPTLQRYLAEPLD